MVKCTYSFLLCITFSSFAAASIKYSIGDQLEYSYSTSTNSMVNASTSYKEIVHIDSISYASSDTFYYYNKLVIETHHYGPRPNIDPIEYYDTILTDTISDNLGYYLQNESEFTMIEDSSALFKLSKLSPNIDTFFFNGSLLVNLVLLNGDTIVYINGKPVQAIQGSQSGELDGYWGCQATSVVFSDAYGLYDFSCSRPIPQGTSSESRHLEKVNGQPNTNTRMPTTLRRMAHPTKAKTYLLNGKLFFNNTSFGNAFHKYRQFMLSK